MNIKHIHLNLSFKKDVTYYSSYLVLFLIQYKAPKRLLIAIVSRTVLAERSQFPFNALIIAKQTQLLAFENTRRVELTNKRN